MALMGSTTTYFNPPSPCGEGRWQRSRLTGTNGISIHPPHAGRDVNRHVLLLNVVPFQSTLPMRGGTISVAAHIVLLSISIHPPHAGRDSTSSQNIFGNLCTYHKTSH